jgi:hypothetical protein
MEIKLSAIRSSLFQRLSCTPICIFSGIVVLACLFYMGWLLLDRRPTVEVTDAKITPYSIKAGDKYTFSFTAKPLRNGGCNGEIDAYEIDSSGGLFLYERNIVLNQKPEGSNHYTRIVSSHSNLTPGPARYGRHIRKWCNLMQKIFWPMAETRETAFMVKED